MTKYLLILETTGPKYSRSIPFQHKPSVVDAQDAAARMIREVKPVRLVAKLAEITLVEPAYFEYSATLEQ